MTLQWPQSQEGQLAEGGGGATLEPGWSKVHVVVTGNPGEAHIR